ncbi:hypothetical protein [Nesterenkonia pannonica]|uniref:hypothetical protein n=1 Tax=Nesterenkonia pannonica TaxID=1548602 RepID=UPI002164C7F9|nr:hypothetical protein [Nesterenkonia pannonica]
MRNSWTSIVIRTTGSAALALGLMVALAALLGGGAGAASSAMVGSAVVLMFLMSLVLFALAQHYRPEWGPMVLLAAFIAKVALIGGTLLLAPIPHWLDTVWTAVTVVVLLFVWQAMLVLGVWKMRATVEQ